MSLQLTADHPVRVWGSRAFPYICSADKLVPGEHKVRCLRHVDVSIKAIKPNQTDVPCLVSLNLRHPNRYNLLAGPPQSDSILSEAVPVGSADLVPFSWNQDVCMKPVDMVSEDGGSSNRILRRWNSAPGGLMIETGPSQEGNMPLSSTSSSGSSSVDIAVMGMNQAAALATFQQVSAQGLQTRGGLRHPHSCVPCGFHGVGKSCKGGVLCSYCHEPVHVQHITRKERRQRALQLGAKKSPQQD
eukprot:TRINITY_DN14228_c0_g2_i2.p1 TRINITY_DN14228_c0_g2~~TRINITY_DN14228_c0_g2_i2.p1  ORF type:complete len:244 (-),score=26.33 TRINITY_DN14228_c0_g2_i2:209-940(-)